MRPALLFLLVASCGRPAHPERGGGAAESKDAAPELAMDEATARDTAEGLLEVLATMATIVEQRTGDCPAMAADLGMLFDQAQPLVEIIEAAKKDAEASRMLGAAMKELELKVTPLVERISPALETCKADPAVIDVMQRMPVF